MDVIIHKRIESLDRLVPKWEDLPDRFREATIFQDVEWMSDWWEQKKNSEEITPYIVEIRKKNETIGIIPLYLSEISFAKTRFRMLRPIGVGVINYLLPILSKNHSPEQVIKIAMNKIYKDKKNWDFILWSDLPEGSSFDTALLDLIKERESKRIERKKALISPQVVLDKDYEVVKSRCSKKFLKGIHYYERKLKREGDLHYHRVINEQDIEPIMNKLFDFHCERWKLTDTPSKFEVPEERDLMLKKVRRLFNRDILHLSYLSHNEEIAAVELGFIDQKTRILYIGTTNPKFKKYPVGHIIVYKLMEEACAEGYEIMDFLGGNQEYKQKWGPVNVVNIDYLIFNSSIKSAMYRLINNTYNSKQFLQTFPFLRFPVKLMIWGSVFLLGVIDKLWQKVSGSERIQYEKNRMQY
ncbi:GNAT family N-acetyltransferase [Bacillus sp. FJAT-49711]|uniref:GNAT family N-acetyltransferase n=1 Tax=Bacillus sp. FJAT-49711 TaxID=2833585 RepID=UPI001BC9AC94|nr:GNAT family N-acetyltransferase [Bacillus sp. FJAT-49711]MBS4220171.1 GNAT family N-acetyltransferase [Bacillus sp. FJAT-49711]